LIVVEQIPDGGGASVPGAVGVDARAVEFVEPAIVVVEHQDVTIACAGIGVAFDVGSGGDGHGTGITFVAVGVEDDVHGRLRGVDYGIGDAHVAAVVFAGTKIGMERDGGADEIDIGVGVGIYGGGGDVLVPGVVGGEGAETVEARAWTCAHAAAGAGLRGGIDLEIDARGSALPGVGIADGNGKDAHSGRVSGSGELGCGDIRCGEGNAGEKDLRAGKETAAGYGEAYSANVGRGGIDGGEEGRRVEEGHIARAACGRIRGTRRLNRNRVRIGERYGGGVITGGGDGAGCGIAAGDVADGPSYGGGRCARNGGTKLLGATCADIGGTWRNGDLDLRGLLRICF